MIAEVGWWGDSDTMNASLQGWDRGFQDENEE